MTTDQPRPTNGNAAGAEKPRRGRRRSPADMGPVARFEPGRVAEARHRNPGWLLGGILLVLLSALGGVLLFSSRDDRREALVSTRDLAAGEVLGRADLRIERVALDGRVDSVDAATLGQLVGQRAVGPVPRDALVHPGMFSPDPPLGPDEMDIGAALDPGEFPQSNIPIGSLVELLVSDVVEPAGDSAGGDRPSTGAQARSIGTGVVTAVEERATGQLLVTVRVTRDVGLVAVQANRDDALHIASIGTPS